MCVNGTGPLGVERRHQRVLIGSIVQMVIGLAIFLVDGRAPGGKIVWRYNGMIDSNTAIAASIRKMTPYYQPPKPTTLSKKE